MKPLDTPPDNGLFIRHSTIRRLVVESLAFDSPDSTIYTPIDTLIAYSVAMVLFIAVCD